MLRKRRPAISLGLCLLAAVMRSETSLAADDWVTQGEVEAGAGYVFDDEYRFGRYNGLTDDGAVAVINADIQRRRDDGAYQRLEAPSRSVG